MGEFARQRLMVGNLDQQRASNEIRGEKAAALALLQHLRYMPHDMVSTMMLESGERNGISPVGSHSCRMWMCSQIANSIGEPFRPVLEGVGLPQFAEGCITA